MLQGHSERLDFADEEAWFQQGTKKLEPATGQLSWWSKTQPANRNTLVPTHFRPERLVNEASGFTDISNGPTNHQQRPMARGSVVWIFSYSWVVQGVGHTVYPKDRLFYNLYSYNRSVPCLIVENCANKGYIRGLSFPLNRDSFFVV